jgi:hypothetical protein
MSFVFPFGSRAAITFTPPAPGFKGMLFQLGMWGGRKPQKRIKVPDQLARRSSRPLKKTLKNQKPIKNPLFFFVFFPGAPDTSVHPVTYHNIF